MSIAFTKNIPTNPGCYLMKNESGAVVYVGKAKNLRKRVSSYWRARDYKTTALVAEIADIETIVTDTEEEALILEAQLIQTHHPKYNIDLQTPGRYAYIKLTEEVYPRFVIVRKVTKDGKFFGPYPSAAARNQMLRSANALFRLCSAKRKIGGTSLSLPLYAQSLQGHTAARNDRKACFRYYLGQCAGACAGLVSKEDHAMAIKSATRFLRGEFSGLIKETTALMQAAADNEQFEQARIYRDRLRALQKREEQKLSESKRYDQDIVNYIVKGGGTLLSLPHYAQSLQGHAPAAQGSIIIQLFHFNRGIISGRKEFVFDLNTLAARDVKDILRDFLIQYYNGHAIPREIVLPEHISDEELLANHFKTRSGHVVSFVIPQRGKKRKLLEMVKKNIFAKLGDGGGQLTELQRILGLQEIPRAIDCVDVSHLSGTETVGSLVQFTNGQPTKSGYRKFKMKTVKGNNDVASIYEVVSRFGKRVKEGNEKRPDLLMIDGGKGQLNGALRALESVGLDLPTIGLAKRLEEIILPGAKHSVILPPRSAALQLLRAIRDEAHRFAITFQRKRRRKV